MREELADLIEKGLNNDQIIEYYVNKYGSQEVLASPIDKGFNRMAWLLPYVAGGVGIVVVGGMALRWTRRPEASHASQSAPVVSAELESRLDDELRDLD
jgi:cytochrome c-type biogenesis protein CcmH/NrfF